MTQGISNILHDICSNGPEPQCAIFGLSYRLELIRDGKPTSEVAGSWEYHNWEYHNEPTSATLSPHKVLHKPACPSNVSTENWASAMAYISNAISFRWGKHSTPSTSGSVLARQTGYAVRMHDVGCITSLVFQALMALPRERVMISIEKWYDLSML